MNIFYSILLAICQSLKLTLYKNKTTELCSTSTLYLMTSSHQVDEIMQRKINKAARDL